MLQRNVFLFNQKLKYDGKYGLKDVLHSLGTEAIQRAEIGSLPPSQPNKGNSLSYRFGDLTRGIDSLGVGVNDDYGKHFGVIAITTATGVGCVKDGVVQPMNSGIYDTNEKMFWNLFLFYEY